MKKNINTVYCKKKFSHLKIDVEKRLLYNCHKAYPHRINTKWLQDNPGKIFNTNIMLHERQQMLDDKKNFSCSHSCYSLEDKGLHSERQTTMDGIDYMDHQEPYSDCEHLDLMLTTDCNLTCLYCSGQYSSAWRREVNANGPYEGVGKTWNDIFDKVSQKQKKETPFYKILLREISSMEKLKTLLITGGEPLLVNYLEDFVQIAMQKNINLTIYTGLGVSEKRFIDFIKKIKNSGLSMEKLTITVSAEGIEDNYKFVRQNNINSLDKCVNLLKEHNIKVRFNCTVSNISLFGLRDFYDVYNKEYQLRYNVCSHPIFLQKHIMDPHSKSVIKKQWQTTNDKFAAYVLQGLDTEPSLTEKQQLKNYLFQLKNNKKVNLDCLPSSFLSWLDQ